MLRLSDYLTADERVGNSDATAKVQAFANDLVAKSRANTEAGADFGLCAPYLNGWVTFGPTDPTDGAGWKAHLSGEGVEHTIFKTGPNGGIRFNDLWGGRVEGFTVKGPGKGKGTGIVFGAAHQDMGCNSFVVESVQATDLQVGIRYGDETTPQSAAAEIVLTNVSTLRCIFGSRYGQWNGLDFQHIKCGAGECQVGWHTSFSNGAAGQASWSGGATYNNDTDFALYGYNFILDNVRVEPRSKTGPRIVGGFGGNGMLSIRQFLVSTNASVPTAISLNGGMALNISQSYLHGAIEMTGAPSSLLATQNGFCVSDGKPFKLAAGTRVAEFGNWHTNQPAGGTPQTWRPAVGFGTGTPGLKGDKGDKGDPGPAGDVGPSGEPGFVSGQLVRLTIEQPT